MTTILPQFLDELRSRVSITEIVGRKVKLSRKGKDYWGLCPFHHEKTPSFSVNDEKGFYHCFGCSEHGDVISFEMNANHLTFMEAVEKLANHAGMAMPKFSAQDEQEYKKRTSLYEIIEKSCEFFEQQLYSPAGTAAMEYLKKRGIKDETVKAFRLGYAPLGNALRDFLSSHDISMEQMILAGLVANKEGRHYDYFRDRLIFPIMDRRGKTIAFGGRILGQGEPKYLNSPENDVFHKSHVLYAFDKSREFARKHNRLIAVEGYMDVIAIHQAGLQCAVAPLGTALTEPQIMAMWQLASEPVLCFDGDKAGQSAALRAATRALPVLKPGYSFKFAWIPEGNDPDDIIRKQGREAFTNILKESQPLSDVIWKVIIGANDFNTPEKKAEIERKIDESVNNIKDNSIRNFYRQHLRSRLFQKVYAGRTGKNKWKSSNALKEDYRWHSLVSVNEEDVKLLIAYILLYPEISVTYLDSIYAIKVDNPTLNNYLQKLTDLLADNVHAVEEEDRKPFTMHVEMLQNRYRNIEFPEPIIAKDMEKKIKSFSLTAIERDIQQMKEDLATDNSPERMEALKALIEEKQNLEKEISY